MQAPPALFSFEQVTVELPTGFLLRELSVSIADQSITVIVGPSGAGKTTLLRLCNRLEVPTSGRVRYRGDDVAAIDPLALRRRVGMVFQRPALFAGTVRDNLLEVGGAWPDDALADVLERVDLATSFLDRPREELSGGEAQRCCLARTLLTEPDVLLMDEPTAALDPDRRLGIEQLVSSLVDDGIAVLWVTHDLDQARRLPGCALVLVDGRLATGEEARAFLARRPEEDNDDH